MVHGQVYTSTAATLRESLTPATRRLIVNADDFGLSPGVNAGVLAAHRAGIVTSASLMANLPAVEEAVALAPPSLGLGLHLNLTTGAPCAGAARVPSLVGRDGHFLRLDRLLWRLSTGGVRRLDLEREIAAQIERLLALGARLDHLDGHHHIHLHPAVRRVAMANAVIYGIHAVRIPAEHGPLGVREAARDRVRRLLLNGACRRARRMAHAFHLATADHFRGLALGLAFDLPRLVATLRALPPGVTELMCHPGYVDAELARRTRYSRGRDRELAALTAPAVRAVLEDAGIVLTRYGALPRPQWPPAPRDGALPAAAAALGDTVKL